MAEIRITITNSSRGPDEGRLRIADRYVECANQSIDRWEREAYAAEADRIYREEGVR